MTRAAACAPDEGVRRAETNTKIVAHQKMRSPLYTNVRWARDAHIESAAFGRPADLTGYTVAMMKILPVAIRADAHEQN